MPFLTGLIIHFLLGLSAYCRTFVSINGVDLSTCGRIVSPCRTISYAMQVDHDNTTKHIMLANDGVIFDTTKEIEITQSLKLEGVGDQSAIRVTASRFLIVRKAESITVEINKLKFVGGNSVIETLEDMSSHVEIVLKNVTFENMKGPVITIYVSASIVMENCIFRRNIMNRSEKIQEMKSRDKLNDRLTRNNNITPCGSITCFIGNRKQAFNIKLNNVMFADNDNARPMEFRGSASSTFNVRIMNSIYQNNTGRCSGYSCQGGALYVHLFRNSNMAINMTNVVYHTNSAMYRGDGNGGAIYVEVSGNSNITMNMKNVTYYNNSAVHLGSGYGGAMFVEADGGSGIIMHMKNVTYHTNSAAYRGSGFGGAIFVTMSGGSMNMIMNSVTYYNNLAVSYFGSHGYGGAVYLHVGSSSNIIMVMKNVTYDKNTATCNNEYSAGNNEGKSHGGAMYLDIFESSSVNIDMNTVTYHDNSAVYRESGSGYGGAIYIHVYSNSKISMVMNNVGYHRNSAVHWADGDGNGGAMSIEISDGSTMDMHMEDVIYESNSVGANRANGNGGAMIVTIFKGSSMHMIMKNVLYEGNSASWIPHIGMGGAIYIDVHASSNMTIKMKNVTYHTNTAIRGGAIYIYITAHSSMNVVMSNVIYHENKASCVYTCYGGGIFVWVHERNSMTMDMKNVTFYRNTARHAGGAAYVLLDHGNPATYPTLNASITRVKYVSNTVTRDNDEALYNSWSRYSLNMNSRNVNQGNSAEKDNTASYPTLNISMTHVKYVENTVTNGKGGALYIEGDTNVGKSVIRMIDVQYTRNTVRGPGGAVYVRMEGEMVIKDSIFESNVAEQGGGALYHSEGTLSSAVIRNSTFIKNKADSGGAAIVTYNQMNIIRSLFRLNVAEFGGVLVFFGGRGNSIIQGCLFESRLSNIYRGSSAIKISDTKISLVDSSQRNSLSSENVFLHSNSILEIDSTFSVRCPRGYNLSAMWTIHDPQEGKQDNKFEYFSVKCIPCISGEYALDEGSLTWVNEFNVQVIKCQSCPPGGSCEGGGRLINQKNYWGFTSGGSVKFVRCPLGYCSNNPDTYNTCRDKRRGNLCGTCVFGYSLSIVSNNCIPMEKCGGYEKWLIILVLLPLILIFLILLKDTLKAYFLQLRTKLGEAICRTSTHDKNDGENITNTTHENSSKASLFTKVTTLLFPYYQLQFFTDVPTPKRYPFWKEIQHLFSTIFSLSITDSEYNRYDTCIFLNYTFVHKKAVNLWLVVYPLFICTVIYLISNVLIKLYRTFPAGDFFKKIKVRLENVFLQFLLLAYIPFSTSLFSLVHCVNIVDKNDRNINALFFQGDMECNQWWQYLVYTVIAIWVAPFVISIYAAITFLQKNEIRPFFQCILFPPAAFVLGIRGIYQKYISKESIVLVDNQCGTNIENESSSNAEDWRGDAYEENEDTDTEITPILSNYHIENEDIDERNAVEKRKGELLEIVQKSYKSPHWLSLETLKKFILVAIFIFVDDVMQRLYSMVFVLLICLIFLVWCKPHRDRVMNWLDTTLTAFLLSLSILSIFDALQIYHIPDTLESRTLLLITHIFRLFLLFSPFVILIIYNLIDTYVPKSNVQNLLK